MTQGNPIPRGPTISIILPTYNRAHLISRAIESVLRQSYTDFELIIIDDASDDNTEEVVRSFQDSRIEYVRLDENKGSPAARNTGIKMARGEYIAFQDSDDEWLPAKLAIQVGIMREAPACVGVVYTGFLRVDRGKEEYIHYRRVARRSGNIHEELLRRNFVTTASILARRESLVRTGLFDENLPRLQDWELVIRLSKDYEFIYIDEALVVSHLSCDSISRDTKAVTTALELILEKHHDEFEQAGTLPDHHYTLSRQMFSIHQYHDGLHHLICGIKRKPGSIKFWVSLITLFPLGRATYAEIVGIVGR